MDASGEQDIPLSRDECSSTNAPIAVCVDTLNGKEEKNIKTITNEEEKDFLEKILFENISKMKIAKIIFRTP